MNKEELWATMEFVPPKTIMFQYDHVIAVPSQSMQEAVELLDFDEVLNLWIASGCTDMGMLKDSKYHAALFWRLARAQRVEMSDSGKLRLVRNANSREQGPLTSHALAQ